MTRTWREDIRIEPEEAQVDFKVSGFGIEGVLGLRIEGVFGFGIEGVPEFGMGRCFRISGFVFVFPEVAAFGI